METKTCALCNKNGSLSEFINHGNICKICYIIDGEFICRVCNIEKPGKEFVINHARYRLEKICKECESNRKKVYYDKADSKTKRLEYQRKWKENPENRARLNASKRKYVKNKREENDINFIVTQRLRIRLLDALSGKLKADRTLELLSCDLEYFKEWLEYQFTPYITWDNIKDHWEIDHIKPCAKFDLSIEDNQRECFAWYNMQPLTKSENSKKRDNYDNYMKFKGDLMRKSFETYKRYINNQLQFKSLNNSNNI